MAKRIFQIGSKGFIASYGSTYEAATATKLNQSNISKCLNKKLKSTGGYRWLYEEEYVQPDQQPEEKVIWFWNFPRIEQKLYEIIIADYNQNRKGKKSFQQVHHLLPKYLYFPYQLLQAKGYQKAISCGKYAEITCDSRSNFKNVVNAWRQLGTIEIIDDVKETINDDGDTEYSTRVYRLSEQFQKEFKKKVFFDASYGKMITNFLKLNNVATELMSGVNKDCNSKASDKLSPSNNRSSHVVELEFGFKTIPAIKKNDEAIHSELDHSEVATDWNDGPLSTEDQALIDKYISIALPKKNWPNTYKRTYVRDCIKKYAKEMNILGTTRYERMVEAIQSFNFYKGF